MDPFDEFEKQPLLDNAHNDIASCGAMRKRSGDLGAGEATISDTSSSEAGASVANGNVTNVEFTYEELSTGFTCPTCHGLGKIPRGREADLVALIPYNDARLKPRRTSLYVMASILACAILAGILCAFLIPRQITLNINAVEAQDVSINTTTSVMNILIQTEFSVTNDNFVSAYSQNATITAFWSDLIKGVNTSSIPATIVGRTTNSEIFANVSATFTEPFLASYCSGASPTHVIYMQFTATVQFKLLSQNQQTTKTYYSPVKCALLDYQNERLSGRV